MSNYCLPHLIQVMINQKNKINNSVLCVGKSYFEADKYLSLVDIIISSEKTCKKEKSTYLCPRL